MCVHVMGQDGAAASLSAHLDLQRFVLAMDQLSMNADGILLPASQLKAPHQVIISFICSGSIRSLITDIFML